MKRHRDIRHFFLFKFCLLLSSSALASVDYPNEPAGFTTVTDRPFNAATELGWGVTGTLSTVTDATAPKSPSSIGQVHYPQGYGGGFEPGATFLGGTQSRGYTRLYVSFWVKLSSNWQGHSSGVNKIAFVWLHNNPVLYFSAQGSGSGTLEPQVRLQNIPSGARNLTPNLSALAVTRGVWHRWEAVLIVNSGDLANGEAHWWLDGTKVGAYTDVNYGSSAQSKAWGDEISWKPIWGGAGDSTAQAQDMWMDHFYVSGGTSGSPPPPDTADPSIPTNLAATAPSSTQINLSWTASTDNVGVTGYKVYRCSGSACTPASLTTLGNVTAYSDTSLTASTLYRYQVTALDAAGNESGLSTIASATTQASSPPPTGTFFQENFEDANLASRGWYDNTTALLSTTEHIAGSNSSMEYRFLQGATTPSLGGSQRHKFTASDSVYLSYYVKYTANWVGSAHLYHPHEFQIMSNQDSDFAGPANGWLVAYVEHNYNNGGIARMALQDNLAINTSMGTPPNNLVGVTENRSTCGCNGLVEANMFMECFNMPPWYNDKRLDSPQVVFKPTAGPGYKNNWNFVEAYFKINSIVGGVAQADGVMQYWFNGALVIDRHDILFRTSARPTIKFSQFIIAPYIGDGSPVAQSMFLDNLTVAAAPPSSSVPCDINNDGSSNVADVQLCVNQAIGTATCSSADINRDGTCNVIDVQRVVNNALGGQCVSP